ncbi:LysR family malonate utilization transcriptional regulator [Orbus hercynius]|uniref:LysR family malonate utilization transcriptional regulator n=1 Tax=Orbus hercynius TaxID=593135 RepID=A0A495RBS0_9GAMM|nr:LysR family transcriptional regulator [Orbus hercynius]RKS84458.1 LysR family malonate utilization transcriptional regulator [Orbus hercynius]
MPKNISNNGKEYDLSLYFMKKNNITLKKLEVFLVFMSKGNISLAADELSLSSVSVHRALHTLEDDINCPLFIHKGRNLHPMPAAYKLQEYAEQILELADEAMTATALAAGIEQHKLKIGALYSLTIDILPKLIMDFKLRKPDTRIDLSMGSNHELLASLENNQLDAVFVEITQGEIDPHNFEILPIFDDQLFIAGAIDSPLLKGTTIDLTTLQDQNFIGLTKGFATNNSFEHVFANTNYTPNISLYVNNIFSQINLVSANMGYSLLPGRMRSAYQDKIKMVAIKQENPVMQTIGLVFAKNREYDPNILSLLACSRMYIHHSKPR